MNLYKKYLQKQNGAVFALFGVLFLSFLFLGGLAADFGTAYLQKTQLQNTADAAALAGASQLSDDITKADVRANITKTVAEYVKKNAESAGIKEENTLTPQYDATNSNVAPESEKYFPSDLQKINILTVYSPVSTTDAKQGKTVYVELRQKVHTYFLHIFGYDALSIVVNAKAKYVPGTTSSKSDLPDIYAGDNSPFVYSIYAQDNLSLHSKNISITGNVATDGTINFTDPGENTKDKLNGSVFSNSNPVWGTKNWKGDNNTFYKYDENKVYNLSITDMNYSTNSNNSTALNNMSKYIASILNKSSVTNITSGWWSDKNEYSGNTVTTSQEYSWSPIVATSSAGTQVYYTSGSVKLNMATSTYTNDGSYKPMAYNVQVNPDVARYYNVVIADQDIDVDTTMANDSSNPIILISLHGNINLHNSADFYGIEYAPNGNIRIDRAGASYGSAVGKTVDIYDEGQNVYYDKFTINSGGSETNTNSSVSLIDTNNT